MNDMEDIKIIALPKYSCGDYEHIAYGVYKNKTAGNYCLCLTAEKGLIYADGVLDAVMDEYTVSCAEYCGEYAEINGEKIWLAELETDSGGIGDLMRMLCIASAAGKDICAFTIEKKLDLEEDVFLCVKLGNVRIKINDGISRYVDIYGVRSDFPNGMLSFEPRYPELPFAEELKELFAKEVFPGNKCYIGILINGTKAFLITKLQHITAAIVIEYGQKKVSGFVKGDEMIRLISSSCQQ